MNTTNIDQNNSIQSININDRLLEKLLINICTLLSTSFAIIVCLLIIIYVLIIYISPTKSKRSYNVSLLLTCNTCFAIICSSTIIILIQLANISGDHHINSLKWIITWACYTRGYLLFVFVVAIYLSYILQAAYRLFSIVFNEPKCLQKASTFLYYIIVQWIISFIIVVPILFAEENLSNSIIYLSEDFYCQVPVTNILSISYAMFVAYTLPLSCICIIYFWIIAHIRHISNTYRAPSSKSKVTRRNKRDTLIIKRICIVMLLLVLLVIPSVVLFIVFILTDHLHWAFYRLSWMTISISYAFICLSSIYVTPQIYRPLRIAFGCSEGLIRNEEDSASIHSITLN